MLSDIPNLIIRELTPNFVMMLILSQRSLIAMGVKKGDHVAIWATNVPQWYITFWATA